LSDHTHKLWGGRFEAPTAEEMSAFNGNHGNHGNHGDHGSGSSARSDDNHVATRLPDWLQSLFWEYHAEDLTWENDRDLIIRRILTSGTWDTVVWLRSQVGDTGLREWIERHDGRGLSPRQLRFWELVLDLPHEQVSAWLMSKQRAVWDGRATP
jgi:hypothetical protein